jgi:hypothetical protein
MNSGRAGRRSRHARLVHAEQAAPDAAGSYDDRPTGFMRVRRHSGTVAGRLPGRDAVAVLLGLVRFARHSTTRCYALIFELPFSTIDRLLSA